MSHVFSGVYFVDKAADIDLNNNINKAISEGSESLIILIGSESEISIATIPAIAKQCSIPLYACVVPGIIYQSTHSFNGILILSFAHKVEATFIKNLSVSQQTIEAELLNFMQENGAIGSAFIFVDGMSRKVESFMTSLYECLGSERAIIGSGAGYSDFRHSPCFADASGCYSNAAMIFSISNLVKLHSIGKHGLHEIAGPFLITEAEGNTVSSLNYQPAFDVYQEAIKQFNGTEITSENFTQHAHCYPFGLKQLDSEHLVRDAAILDDKSLICVGNVAQNSLVYILNSTKEQLFEAASEATKKLSEKLHNIEDKTKFIIAIDCISRALLLQSGFSKELNAINDNLPKNYISVGILSLGEIKNTKQGATQFLNKTLVLGGL